MSPDTHASFVALVEEMTRRGCTFVVFDSDHVEVTNPDRLPDWCWPILEHWAGFAVVVDAYRPDGLVLGACDRCHDLYVPLEPTSTKPCRMPGCGGTYSTRPPIAFTNPAEVAS